MIIEKLLNVIYYLFDALMVLDIPSLPTEVHGYLSQAFEYIEYGASIINVYAPLEYLLLLFGIIVAVDVGIGIYHLVMWVLKKIPMLGIE